MTGTKRALESRWGLADGEKRAPFKPRSTRRADLERPMESKKKQRQKSRQRGGNEIAKITRRLRQYDRPTTSGMPRKATASRT
jgi:hypothetical protein